MQINMATLDGKGYNGPNYFNGNYIVSKNGNVDIVATQGPLEQTTEDFWNVVMLNNVSMIVGKGLNICFVFGVVLVFLFGVVLVVFCLLFLCMNLHFLY